MAKHANWTERRDDIQISLWTADSELTPCKSPLDQKLIEPPHSLHFLLFLLLLLLLVLGIFALCDHLNTNQPEEHEQSFSVVGDFMPEIIN